MDIYSFSTGLKPKSEKIQIDLILETSFSKEMRIQMPEGKTMKKHQTPFPIIVHLVEGEVDFGVNGETHQLKSGDIITLEGGVPHDLLAKKPSIVRLSLSKGDKSERVEDVVQNS